MIKKIVKQNYIYFIVILFLIVVFSIIMRSTLHEKIIAFDYEVIDFMRSISNVYLTFIFNILTNFGDYYIPLLIIVCIFIFIHNKWYFTILSSGYLFAGIITYFTKLLASRPRPLEALITIPKSYSFPSGHTLTSLVFYCLLCYILTSKCKKSVKLILFTLTTTLVCLIALSRIYLGVHYFSDVFGGYLIGIPCLMVVINIVEDNFKEKLK